jgi:hypothetical protein
MLEGHEEASGRCPHEPPAATPPHSILTRPKQRGLDSAPGEPAKWTP